MVFKPETLMAPAPRTNWHIFELYTLTSSASFNPSSLTMEGRVAHNIQYSQTIKRKVWELALAQNGMLFMYIIPGIIDNKLWFHLIFSILFLGSQVSN